MSRTPPLQLIICVLTIWTCADRAWADEDPEIRGKKVTQWFKFLRDEKDPRRRQAALQIIDLQAGPKVAVVFPGLLRELREHPDPAIRARIAELLLKYNDKGDDLIKGLATALRTDKDAKVREAAATTLGRLEKIAVSAAPELSDALKDPAAGVRSASAEALGQFTIFDSGIARDAIPALIQCVKDADANVRIHAVFVLARMGPIASPAVASLAEGVQSDKDANIRKECAKALAAIGPGASDSAAALVKALFDANVEVRQQSAYALCKVNPDAKLALPELLKAVKDKDTTVRCFAIHAVGALGKPATSAIPELIRVLKDDVVAEVRLAAIEELAGFGADAKSALDALMIASRDGKPAIREAAQDAVKKIQQSP